MKQRYTITIADMEINVISDESPENVESLVGNVDRKMREIMIASRRCSKGEAALLCALDYCADKVKALRKVKQYETEIVSKETEIKSLSKENEKLKMEIETLRESLLAAKAIEQELALGKTEPEEPTEAPTVEAAPAEELPAEEAPAVPEAPTEFFPVEEKPTLEPEEIEFDPTEIFRRAKANRGIRKGKKK